MSSSYPASSSAAPSNSPSNFPAVSAPVRVSAGTAVKIGFFGALGATLFSLVLSAIGVLVLVVLALLGIGVGSLFQNLPR